MCDLKTDYKNLSINSLAKLRDESLIGIMTQDSPTIFHSIELLEVTGKGKRLR